MSAAASGCGYRISKNGVRLATCNPKKGHKTELNYGFRALACPFDHTQIFAHTEKKLISWHKIRKII